MRSDPCRRRASRFARAVAFAALAAAALPVAAPATPTYQGGASAGWGYQEGDLLTANPGSWTSTTGIAYSYAWFNENSVALGTGSTYRVAGTDVGHQIYAAITATDGTPPSLTVTTPTVGPMRYRPPVNVAMPTVAGAPYAGSTLVATPGTWVAGGASKAPIQIGYAWYRGCTVAVKPDCSGTGIIGNGSSVALSDADAGRLISLTVTGSYPDGLGGEAGSSVWVGNLGPVVSTSVKAGDALSGEVEWTVAAPGVQTIAFLVNGTPLAVLTPDGSGAAALALDTSTLADGANALAVTVVWKDGTATVQIGTVTVSNAPFTPPPAAVPLIGKPTATPARPVAGRRFTVTFAVTRSDDHRPLTSGRMACDPSLGGRPLRHAESFARGRARVAVEVPATGRHKLLTVRLTIRLGDRTATRTAVFRVR